MRYAAFFMLMMVLTVPAMAEEGPPPGDIYPTAPFTSAQLFNSVPCGRPFKCDVAMSDSDLLAKANRCAESRLAYPKDTLTIFVRDSKYRNCALPETFVPKSSTKGAAAQWPICCVGEMGNGQCAFACHSYIGGK